MNDNEITPDTDEDTDLFWAAMEAEAEASRWDDDPNPYAGTYGEDDGW